jgi:hypothetical protein
MAGRIGKTKMAISIEAQQNMFDEAYATIRSLQENHGVDLATLWGYLRDAYEQAGKDDIEEAIYEKYKRLEAMSTTELIDIVEDNCGEMNLAMASTLIARLSKPGAAHHDDVAPQIVCDAQGLEQGSTWLECAKARVFA